MKKYIILSFVGALSLLSGCDYNDKYFDGLDELAVPTNKLTLEYSLTDDDYATISTLSANKTLATANGVTSALAAIKTNKYLSDAIPATDYVPAFLASKWYSASEGSAVKVTYKKSVNMPDYVAKLNSAPNYTVTAADYKTVWGIESLVNFFTPAKPASTNIPNFLAAAYPAAISGDVVAVNYNESTSEPVTGSTFTATGALYSFNGTKWAKYTGNAYFLTKADFATMGSNYDNFSTTMLADNYLPRFLTLKYPFAQEGTVVAAAYKYYASSKTTVRADEYKFTAGNWVKNNFVQQFTDQFVYTGGSWKYNPSVVVELTPVKGLANVSAFYQAIVTYVGKTFGTGYYQGTYTNAEFYYGASAFQNNISFRISDWRTGCSIGATAYAEYKDDAALTALMNKRIPEAFIPALEAIYPKAAPVDGVNVTYTINFGIYSGTSITATTHTIVYKVIGVGKFEYVKDSFKSIK